MRALVIYAHPREGSFNAAVRDVVLDRLVEAGAEVRLIDLYKRGFDPCLTEAELECYEDMKRNCAPVESDVDDLRWCDTLIFVYPTWWYGLPAILKGWLDRVLVPGVAFLMPDDEHKDIRPGLTHITRLGVFTTCGASWWLTRFIGAPGRRTLMRGVRLICAKRCKTAYAAHHLMDSSTQASREAHLNKVARAMNRFVARGATARKEARA
ncbi:NAD(P)H-dependent oxidoreductase [Litoreibacter roseus]|uniref:NAD(P)H dehydrogenase (Quinone) n=1 Tax=Litoreibacter roseus TaxID=2601869 RepID=A0A6N6JIR5_9RHOB|nr:NAD(P)H-dependent oxidoreductase [Litoreibacter roseus]GFE65178.1 NAD(P)H dehydrogenase (quinone) [Litoreibacter roseus]